ncbi:rhodanese-like domain-containing protein [Paenibacillus ihuae]|uniref:rhodanese-like domain-containing protein n=1 Tax=Paenibacillus ihuae TaxID=1232431 RepID=UPI000A841396|nr:rhodanese-like domain-containing protein [Paenibacillus ihuae]
MNIQAKSQVLSTPAAAPAEAANYFSAKGLFETDVADVAYDLREGMTGFTLVDVRDSLAYEAAHLPGAVSLPSGRIHSNTPPFSRGGVAGALLLGACLQRGRQSGCQTCRPRLPG